MATGIHCGICGKGADKVHFRHFKHGLNVESRKAFSICDDCSGRELSARPYTKMARQTGMRGVR